MQWGVHMHILEALLEYDGAGRGKRRGLGQALTFHVPAKTQIKL